MLKGKHVLIIQRNTSNGFKPNKKPFYNMLYVVLGVFSCKQSSGQFMSEKKK